MTSTAFRHPHLLALAREIDDNLTSAPLYSPTADLWETAGIFVTDDALALTESRAAHDGELGILTRHARPLSWLFFELRTDCRLTGGPGGEHDFFGRLADAANAFLAAHQPEEPDWRPVLLAVLREAGEVLRERYAPLEIARRAAQAVRRPAPGRSRRRTPSFPVGLAVAA